MTNHTITLNYTRQPFSALILLNCVRAESQPTTRADRSFAYVPCAHTLCAGSAGGTAVDGMLYTVEPMQRGGKSMKAIEYRITLTKTSVQIGEGGDVIPISAPQKLYAMATVTENENGETLPLHDILDKLFNQIYGKMTEGEA